MGVVEDVGNWLWNTIANIGDAIINALSSFFKKVFGALKKIFNKIAELLPNRLVAGIRSFTAKVADKLKNLSKTYAKNQVTGQWEETVFQQNIDESEVPAWAMAKLAASNEVETTEELVNELKQAS